MERKRALTLGGVALTVALAAAHLMHEQEFTPEQLRAYATATAAPNQDSETILPHMVPVQELGSINELEDVVLPSRLPQDYVWREEAKVTPLGQSLFVHMGAESTVGDDHLVFNMSVGAHMPPEPHSPRVQLDSTTLSISTSTGEDGRTQHTFQWEVNGVDYSLSGTNPDALGQALNAFPLFQQQGE